MSSMSSMISVSFMVSVIVMLVLMILTSIEGKGVDKGPLVPHTQGSLACHQKTQE